MRKTLNGAMTSLAMILLGTGVASAKDPIKLGVLEDQSGDFAAATIGKVHGIQLATEEINAAGGIAGRPLELVIYDTQSDNTRYQEFMRRVLQRDKVDAVFAGYSSASREVYRPIVNQFDGFAWYNNQYEGGVCDANMVVTGAVPEQQFSTLFALHDGDLRQEGLHHCRRLQFRSDLCRMGTQDRQGQRRPDGGRGVHSARRFPVLPDNPEHPGRKARFRGDLAGGHCQASYYEQAASANLNLPMASSVNVGQGYEHKRFKPPSLANMYATVNWIEEVDNPASKAFVEKWHKKFPNEPYINQEAENPIWQSISTSRWWNAPKAPSRRTICARSSRKAMSAPMHRKARSASTRKASTCRTRSIWPRSTRTTRSASRRCGTTSSHTGLAKRAAT